MGNNNCTLVVRTEQQSYVSGSKCSGRVYLSINQDFIPCHSLHIQFEGLESAVVHYTRTEHHSSRDDDHDNHRHHEDHYERDESFILKQDYILQTCQPSMHGQGSGFHRGQYEFPFEFIVPNQLPSSLYCRHGESHCEIKYALTAYLQKTGSSGTGISMNPFKRQHTSSKMPLIIYGDSTTNNVSYPIGGDSGGNMPVHFPSETQRINYWCCINRGQMHLEAQLKTEEPYTLSSVVGLPTLQPNTPYNVTFNVSNQSTAAIQSIQMELIETVSWKPRYRSETSKREITKQSLDGMVLEGDQHGGFGRVNDSGHLPTGTSSDYVPISPVSGNGANGPRSFRFVVPQTARDTYNGRMIQVHHFLRIKIVTSCCLTEPETSMDLKIVHHNLSLPSLSSGFENTGNSYFSNEMVPPSAPPAEDNYDSVTTNPAVVVEAIALPPNWSPQTADVIALPVATVVGTSEDSNAFNTNPSSVHASVPGVAPSAPPLEK